MSRDLLPLQTADLSAFARALAAQLSAAPHPPGHQTLLNMLARAAGHRNIQGLKAARTASPVARRAVAPAAPLPMTETARKALAQFDASGVMVRWPQKHAVQRLALWVLWTRFEPKRVYTHQQVNQLLNAWHAYGDPATLRRELIGMALISRKPDCSEYRKLPNRPSEEVRALIQALRHPVA